MSRASSRPPWPYHPPSRSARQAPSNRQAYLGGRSQPSSSIGQPQDFTGQLPGERVIWTGRQSSLFLLMTGWPLLAGLLVVLVIGLASDALGSLTLSLLGLVTLPLLIFGLWWAAARGWGWIFQRYILTDQRVIKSVGSFWRRREEIELKSIVQVRVQRRNPLLMLLGMGDVELRTAGAPVLLVDVAHPHEIANAILVAMDSRSKKPEAAPPVPNQRVQAALDELAQPASMPPVPPMRHSAPPGLSRRKIPVRLLEGEALVEVVYRHWFVLLRSMVLAVGLLAAAIVVSATLAAAGAVGWAQLVVLGGGCVAVIAGFLTYLNWANDVFILTTQRVIDIDRLFFVLAQSSNDAPYGKVQNVRVQQALVGKLLGFGSILVETAGREYPLEMKDIPHAFDVMNRIFAQISLAREREQIAAANTQKQESYRWLSTVVSRLLVTVPDVRGLPLLHAIAAAHGAGLRLVVAGERPLPSGLPGRVLEQVPYPGTCALSDAELRVMLSSIPGAATPTGRGH